MFGGVEKKMKSIDKKFIKLNVGLTFVENNK